MIFLLSYFCFILLFCIVIYRPTMSTKKALSDAPGEEAGEFDVSFGEGELGMRLEERGSFKMSSVVIKVTEEGKSSTDGL